MRQCVKKENYTIQKDIPKLLAMTHARKILSLKTAHVEHTT